MRQNQCMYATPRLARFGNQYCKLLGKDSMWTCPYHGYEQITKCRIIPIEERVDTVVDKNIKITTKTKINVGRRFDDKLISQFRADYPQFVEYLTDVRGYSRIVVTDMFSILCKLHNLGYTDEQILSSDVYEMVNIAQGTEKFSAGWSKKMRASLTRFKDYNKYMQTIAS